MEIKEHLKVKELLVKVEIKEHLKGKYFLDKVELKGTPEGKGVAQNSSLAVRSIISLRPGLSGKSVG